MSRLTPFRTRTCTRRSLCDQPLELARAPRRPAAPRRRGRSSPSRTRLIASPVRFLSRRSACQARSGSTRTGCGRELALDLAPCRGPRGAAPRAARARRPRRAAGRSRPPPRAPWAKVWPRLSQRRGPWSCGSCRQMRGLVRRRRRARRASRPGEQPRLHELGHPLPPLALGQRLEQRLVEHDPRRPVEGADEVLALRDVDRRSCRRSRRRPGRRASSARPPRRRRAGRSRRRSRRRRSCSRRRARRPCRRGRAGARARAASSDRRPTSPPRRPAARATLASRAPSASWARAP